MFSPEFNDIYFSTEDGLAESRHTYLAGNSLPQAWLGKDSFHILELGFGSGLNFLATFQLWQETAQPGQQLFYTAVEKHPCTAAEIAQGLARWQQEIGPQLHVLTRYYRPQSVSMPIADNVTLTLLCADVAEALPQLVGPLDAFYLDGFAPAKNPAMWSEAVFGQLARLSHAGSTFATFTVARAIRDRAMQAGFQITKLPGYGRKEHMLAGIFKVAD